MWSSYYKSVYHHPRNNRSLIEVVGRALDTLTYLDRTALDKSTRWATKVKITYFFSPVDVTEALGFTYDPSFVFHPVSSMSDSFSPSSTFSLVLRGVLYVALRVGLPPDLLKLSH